MKGKHKLKERLLAFVLTFALVMGMVIQPMELQAAEIQGQELDGQDPEEDVQGDDGVPVATSLESDMLRTGGEPVLLDGETVSYAIEIQTPSGPFYPGETCSEPFIAKVKKITDLDPDGTYISSEGITWTCETGNGSISDGILTVAENAVKDTGIIVKASYKNQDGDVLAEETATVSVSERGKYQIAGVVKDSFDDTAISGATVTLVKETEYGTETEPVVTGENGEYAFCNVLGDSGIRYHILVTKDGEYKQKQLESFELNADKTVEDVLLTTDQQVTLTGADSLKIDDTIEIVAEYPENWGTDEVRWNVEGSSVNQVQAEGKVLTLKGIQQGTASVTATVHGVTSSEKNITVSRRTVTNAFFEEVVADNLKVGKETEFVVHIQGDDASISGEKVMCTIQKPDGASETIEGLELGQDGKVSFSYIWEYAGEYKVSCKLIENRYEEITVEESYTIKGKGGQCISIAGAEKNYIYGDTVALGFTARVANIDRAKVPENWKVKVEYDSKFEETGSVTFSGIQRLKDTTDEIYEVTGSVTFPAEHAAKTVNISVSYSHVEDSTGKKVYEDAMGNTKICIGKKALSVDSITFADKVYDKTTEVIVTDIKLDLDQLVFDDDREAIKAKTGAYHLDGFNVVDESGKTIIHTINTEETPVTLLENEISVNYEVDNESVSKYGTQIIPKTLKLKVDNGEREYGTEGNFDKEMVSFLEGWEPYDEDAGENWNDEYDVYDSTQPSDVPKVKNTQENDVEYDAYQNVLQPMINGTILTAGNTIPSKNLNYQYSVEKEDEDNYGELTIIPMNEENAKKYIQPDMDSDCFIAEDGTIWVQGAVRGNALYEDKKLTVNIANDHSLELFQNVKMSESQDASDDSVVSEEIQSTGGLEVKFELGELNEGQEKTIKLNLYNDGVCCTEDIDLTVKIDSKAPEATFSNLTSGKTKLQELISDITFDMFDQKTFYGEVKLSEGGAGLASGQPGEKSDVAWRYVVLHISDDIQEELLCEKLSDIPDDKWTAGIGEEIKDIPIGVAENGEALEGNYIVAVKTYDRLGNSYVYTSNGMVIENRAPQITIPDQSVLKYNLEYMQKKENTIEIPDVVVKDFSTEEGLGISSAVQKITYEVFRGSQTDESEDIKKLAYGTLYESSAKDGLKWSDLNGESGYTCIKADSINFKVTEEFDYNNIWLRVTAIDKSGNQQAKTVALNIDVSRPTIVVRYQNEQNTTVSNVNYFNGNRKAVMTVKDKNISVDGFRLNLKLTDKKLEQVYNVNASLGELRELKDLSGKNIFEDVSIGNVELINPEEQISQIPITFVFSGEDKYEVDFECVDAFDNADTGKDLKGQEVYGLTYETDVTHGADECFIIDKTAPVVTQIFSVNGSELNMLSGERIYQQDSVAYDIYITEHNFYSDGKEFGVTSATTREKYKDGVWDPSEFIKDGKNWAANGINGIAEQWKFSFIFKAEGNYTHFFEYKDLAGNPAIYVDSTGNPISNIKALFTIDDTNPTGSVSINGFGFWESLLEKITFGLFSPSTVDVEVNGKDYTSPVYPIQYQRFHDQMSREQLEAYDWSQANAASGDNPGYGAFSVSPDEQFVVYMKVTDYAGNYEYFSSDGMIVDSTKPAPKVTITNLSQAQNGIFNEDVTLQIDVTDPTQGDTYSGLERVWYTVSATGNVSASQTIELLDNSNDRVQGNQTFRQVITVPASVYNSNDVKVQAFAVDFSGNQGESETTELKIDVTNPSISVSWDLNNGMNGKYYKDTRTATVTVTDRNFDPNNVRFSITNTDGAQANIGGWSSSSNIGVSDSATSTCQVSFPADGDYTFTLGCTDLAGNSTEYGQTDEFTIDKTVPEISVSYDNNNARNGNYYKEARTATVTVREHNFNAADVKAAITASLEGRGISAPSISGFSGSGDVHTATVRYAADGDYTFDVEYTDMAGNQASDYTPDQFTVDLTVPEVEITDVEDKSANNDVVSPSVKATDVNYDSKNVTVTITGANNGKVDISKVVSAVENGQTMKFSDFARQEKMDDLYTLTAKAVDLAGNEKEESILFSVNRFGSVYVLDDDTKEWLSTKDYTYINEEKEVGVKEYNVDTIKDSSITVNRDGELTNLKEKTDYTVTSSGTEAQWKENHYVMKAENFTQEGNYAVILSTQDKAANAMNNTSVKKSNGNLPIEFAVDKTAPTVVISGVEDGGSYRSAERTMTVDAKDNLALDEVSVDIDGNTTVYHAEELKETDGIIDVVIGRANDFQEIQVTASDAAGNVLGQKQVNGKGQPVALSVLVTPNVMVQYYMNKPLFFGSILGVLVIAGVIIFLVWRRKQSKNGR